MIKEMIDGLVMVIVGLAKIITLGKSSRINDLYSDFLEWKLRRMFDDYERSQN